MDYIFKFDDNNRITLGNIICLLIDVFLCIFFYYVELMAIMIIMLILSLIGIYFMIRIYLSGIYFNFNKKIVIIRTLFSTKKINMKDIIYISMDEIEKQNKTYNFLECFYFSNYFHETDYVYNNGKVFNFNFHIQGNKISVYYGYLFKSNSIERIENQVNLFDKINKEFKKFKIDNCL